MQGGTGTGQPGHLQKPDDAEGGTRPLAAAGRTCPTISSNLKIMGKSAGVILSNDTGARTLFSSSAARKTWVNASVGIPPGWL